MDEKGRTRKKWYCSIYSSVAISLIGVIMIWSLIGFGVRISEVRNTSFSAVEALFSGFAFSILIIAVILQNRELSLQREELRLQREELEQTRMELKRTADAQEKTERIQNLHAELMGRSLLSDIFNKEARTSGNDRVQVNISRDKNDKRIKTIIAQLSELQEMPKT